MSHPYLCPSAWISAKWLFSRRVSRIIYGWMCFFLPPRSWNAEYKNTDRVNDPAFESASARKP